MKKENSSLPKIFGNEIMTLAENLAFLAGFAEGLAKGQTSGNPIQQNESLEDEIEALIADAELELPKDGWRPVERFQS